MQKLDFNNDWQFRRLNGDEDYKQINIPHDAMISEPRSMDSDGGTNTGWFAGNDYEYVKSFSVPEDYKDKVAVLEFEGVYRNSEVFLNGEKLCYRPYGYTNFYVDLTDKLKCGEQNEIRVTAKNSDQPNSRWYSGAGIYRPVNLYVSGREHIKLNGVKIRTLSVSPATVEISVKTEGVGDVQANIMRSDSVIASVSGYSDGEARFTVTVDNAVLWTPETPNLYDCEVKFNGDSVAEKFGIRTVSVSPENGFMLNGKRVIIRGACIHHDNGILGARCYREAEERKIKLMKENGYNAVRSAHNPCSKYMLEACDKLGVMMMDEYTDMWYIHKTMHDYADYVTDWYAQDITDMIEKDFNHPSVIMYSLGNEVAETAQKRGIEFFKQMKAVCKSLDPDRPVTAGVNIFFNLLHSMGFGVYSDKKAKTNPQKKVGSEFFNNLAGKLGGGFMKRMATLHACDVKTRGCFAAMDVAGYNYGILRYKHDIKKYPNRVILGSETFCSDAYRFYEFAKSHPAVIGDFVWSGMDYIGEVGVGSWEYRDYAPDFKHGVGWITAGSGRVDLIGNPLGEALYTRVAFGLTDIPQIAVVPVNHTHDKHSPSAWKFSNAISSWSFNGQSGKKARVEVYSRAPVIELYVNGKRVGRKKFKKNCRFDFTTKYYDGEVTAVALDKKGNEISRNSLRSAGEKTVLSVVPEVSNVKAGEVCFVRLKFTDEAGTVKPSERGIISVNVTGGELLGIGNACPYNELGYCGNTTDTYYGEAMAVVRATGGTVTVSAECGELTGRAEISAI